MEAKETQCSTQGTEKLGGGEFVSEGVQVNLTLTYDGISWTTVNDKRSVTLEWCDVIRCHKGMVSARKAMDIQDVTHTDSCFTVHYIDKHKNPVWRHNYKTFKSNGNSFDGILTTMCEQCTKDHPRRLLVVINPAGGTGKGKAQYTHIVAPLFKLAQIETDVIVSKDPKHPQELGETYAFSSVDGVVVAGGDGTYQQLIHTWLPRLQKDAGINMKDSSADLKPLPCPIGMIPTGSANGLAKAMCGCFDIETAALHIITGRRLWKHLAGVRSCGTNLGFSGIVVANGSWSDILDGENDYRWLGPLRFPVSVMKIILRQRREFDIKLEYLPYDAHKDGHSLEPTISQLEWECIEGRYTGVVCLPGIMYPNEATGKFKVDNDGEGLTLILEKQCGRFKYFSWLIGMQKMENDMFDEDFLTVKQVKAYTLKIVHKEGENIREEDVILENRCKIDGEACELNKSQMEVRVHPKLMEMFGTG